MIIISKWIALIEYTSAAAIFTTDNKSMLLTYIPAPRRINNIRSKTPGREGEREGEKTKKERANQSIHLFCRERKKMLPRWNEREKNLRIYHFDVNVFSSWSNMTFSVGSWIGKIKNGKLNWMWHCLIWHGWHATTRTILSPETRVSVREKKNEKQTHCVCLNIFLLFLRLRLRLLWLPVLSIHSGCLIPSHLHILNILRINFIKAFLAPSSSSSSFTLDSRTSSLASTILAAIVILLSLSLSSANQHIYTHCVCVSHIQPGHNRSRYYHHVIIIIRIRIIINTINDEYSGTWRLTDARQSAPLVIWQWIAVKCRQFSANTLHSSITLSSIKFPVQWPNGLWSRYVL